MATHQAPPRQGTGYQGYGGHTKDRIYRANGYRGNGYTYYPVVIVGAGESGICMAHKLKKELGVDQFRIYDRQSGVGGTWWINRYPGIACDVPAAFYSFSWSPNPRWTAFYPPGPEIYEYLQDVCDKFGFTEKIELNTDVTECRWLPQAEEWEVTLQHMVPGTGDLTAGERAKRVEHLGEFSVYTAKETVRCKVLVSAVGGLVEPKPFPDVPGAENFKGKMFHSARWEYNVDFNNKDVVVIGTGCSAAQFVPCLTKAPFNAKSVTQIMRSPPWVVPKNPTPGGEEMWAKYAPYVFTYVPGVLRALRTVIFIRSEYDWILFGDKKVNEQARENAEKKMLARMKKLAPAEYHEILTPNYSIACKRRIFDETWYPALHEKNIKLTTMPLTSIQESSVTLGPGKLYPADVRKAESDSPDEQKAIPADIIVQANGYETHQWLHPLKITGEGGRDLIETMMERGGSQAYQGTALDGFPNFFIIFGPNTATGHSSVILQTEQMVDYAGRFIELVLKGDVRTVDVKKEAEVAYTQDIQAKLKDTVFMKGGCSSWYFNEKGWNATVLPYSQIWFWYRCHFPRWNDWNIRYTTKGLIKLVLSRSIKLVSTVVLAILLLRVYRFKKRSEMTMSEMLQTFKYLVLGGTIYSLNRAKKAVAKLM